MILSIDYGEKKVGLALSDETELVGSALPTLKIKTPANAIELIREICGEKHVSKIVVGVPSGWQNIDSPQTKIVREFIAFLKVSIKLPVDEWDESYSTKIAERNISGKQKKNSDSYAAMVILQEYLDYLRNEKNHI